MRDLREESAQWLEGWNVRQPFLVIGGTVLLAALPALWLPLWALPLLALVAVATLLVRRWRRPLWCLIAVPLALFLLTTAVYRWQQVESLTSLHRRQDTITAQVVALPSGGRMATVEVIEADLVPTGTKMALFFPEDWIPSLWDTVTTRVTLNAEPFSAYQPGRGVFLSAVPLKFDEQQVQYGDGEVPLPAVANDYLYNQVRQHLPQQQGSVLAALCLGRKEALPASLLSTFQKSGLGHLLVVSGLHLTLMVLAFRLLLRRCRVPWRMSAALTIPAMAAVMALVGVSPSVMRAGLMCLCWLVGILFRRHSFASNALGMAAMVLLMMNPYQIYSAGFQLSFLATAGVVFLTPRLCDLVTQPPPAETPIKRLVQKGFRLVYTAAAVCVGALLFTLPVLCYYFGGFSVLTLLANLLAVVPAGWVLLWGWVGLLCCSVPFLAWLGRPILTVAGWGAEYLTAVARWCSASWAQVAVSTLWQWLLVIAVCLILIVVIMCKASLRRSGAVLMALVLLTVTVGGTQTTSPTKMTVCSVTNGVAVLVEQGDQAALFVSHSGGLIEADRLLREVACSRLDWLVVAQGSPQDTGALTALYHQAGCPTVATLGAEPWHRGATCPVTELTRGLPVTLWEGCTLTATTETWWRLDGGADPVQIGTDPKIPCPFTEGFFVYPGLAPAVHTPSVVVCSATDLTEQIPEYAEETLLLTDDFVTFTVQPDGEWSELPWL